MKSTEKYIKNILLTKVIALGLPILRSFKTSMQDRKLPRKQGNAREYVKIVICPGSIEGLGKSYSSGGARPKDYHDDGKRRDY